MRGMIEQECERPPFVCDLEQLNLAISGGVSHRANEIPVPAPDRNHDRPLLLGDGLRDERKELVGEPASVSEVSRHNLNRSGVIVSSEQNQMGRRKP